MRWCLRASLSTSQDMRGDQREEEEEEPNPLASYGPGRIIKPVGKQRFRGWEVVAEATIEVILPCRHG